MKRLALLLASTAFVTPALAADIIYEEPPAPMAVAPVIEIVAPGPTWTGLYVGVQAGVAFNSGDENDISFNTDDDGIFDDDDDDSFFDDGDDDDTGFIGGVRVGYDQQFGNFVVGALADINYIDAETNRVFSFDNDHSHTFDSDESFSVNQDIEYLGTVRARAGFAFDSVLVYGTGGLTYAGVDREMTFPSTGAGSSFEGYEFEDDGDDADFGYNIGGGVEFLVTDNLSFGVEYLYHNLGEDEFEVDAIGPADGFDDDVEFESRGDDLDFHTIWATASYRFN